MTNPAIRFSIGLFSGVHMPINLKLPALDDNPILLAETRSSKINEFIQNLPLGDPIRAASDLTEELQILNSQKVAFSNRMNALELYRAAAIELHQELLSHFSNTSLPISRNARLFASAAEQMWQEFAYGYKLALVDLQNKILNINNNKSTAQVVQRAIHAIKEVALTNYLIYHAPSGAMWSEIHQLYYCALKQAAHTLKVEDSLTPKHMSSVNIIYTQVLLLSLANPHRLVGKDILKTDAYLTKISEDAELRGVGIVNNPTGIFVVSLNSDKPPRPYVKNSQDLKEDSDVLLITVKLAKRIHLHLKALKSGVVPSDEALPAEAIKDHDEDLLVHLIKHFGKSPLRLFSRSVKSDGMEMGLGIHAAHYFIPRVGEQKYAANGLQPSRWQVLNVSAGGYAVRKFNSSDATLFVGDVAAIKNNKTLMWELGIVRWANINVLNQLDIGVELISPSATAVGIKAENSAIECEGLLLPELRALRQPGSLIIPRDYFKSDDRLILLHAHAHPKIKLTQLIERTATSERYQYSLI
jgi:cyclic-di-GMP-binding protein